MLEVHEVGQGSCVTVRFQKDPKSEPEFMVVDAGTLQFREPHTYTQKKKEEPLKESSATPSQKKASDYPQVIGEPEPTTEEDENEYIRNLRKKFITKAEGSLRLKTVIITHPDADHYNWLDKIFNNLEDQIDHIILGRLPENYHLGNKKHKFREWLEVLLNSKSTVYFPEIKHDPITSPKDLEGILDLSKKRLYAQDEYSMYAPLKQFRDAFNFGKGVSIDILSTCPTHSFKKGNIIRDEKADTNDDSLVLKITNNNNSSALLTGDATGVTLERILANYEKTPDFLESDVFLACHHGSKTRGSNQSSFIDKVKFSCAFISAGHVKKYAHPQEKITKQIEKSKAIKKSKEKHEVLTFKEKKKESQKAEEEIEVTQATYFSTLSSGNLRAKLPANGPVKIETDREKEIDTPSSSPQNSDDEDQKVKTSQKKKRKFKGSEGEETQQSKDKEEEEEGLFQSKKQKKDKETTKKSSPSKTKSRPIEKKKTPTNRKVTTTEEKETCSKKYNLRPRPKKERTKKTPTKVKKRKTQAKRAKTKDKE